MSRQRALFNCGKAGYYIQQRDVFCYQLLNGYQVGRGANRTSLPRLARHFDFFGLPFGGETRGAHKERACSLVVSLPDTGVLAFFGFDASLRFGFAFSSVALRASFSASACSALLIRFLAIMPPSAGFLPRAGLHCSRSVVFAPVAWSLKTPQRRRCLLATPGAMTELK
jgi:hypothetical protein